VNELESSAFSPLLASPQGGVAERSRNVAKHPLIAKPGSFSDENKMKTKGKPPRLRPVRWLREIFLMTQPPLLAVIQGGDYHARFQFLHTFCDRCEALISGKTGGHKTAATVDKNAMECDQNFGTLIRPSHRLLLFSSHEYSIISQSGRRMNVRVFVHGFVKVLGSSMVTS
jgi:hypothetical protein